MRSVGEAAEAERVLLTRGTGDDTNTGLRNNTTQLLGHFVLCIDSVHVCYDVFPSRIL